MKITALVVTYNRIDWLKKSLKSLTSQTRKPDEILVIDNSSTDGTGEFLKHLSEITVKTLDENTGGAGGFSYGLKCAIDDGADWVWMMDDDALPYKNALEELERAILENQKSNVGVFLSKLANKDNLKSTNKISTVSTGTFVGFTVKKEVVEKVGLPDADFFIYADDYDYSMRIQRAGFKIMKVYSSLIEHKDWIRQKRAFRFPFSKPNVPPWKTYYLFRNPILATKNSKIVNLGVKMYLSIDRYIWSYVSPEAKPYIFSGYQDGKNGVKGKRIDPKKPLFS